MQQSLTLQQRSSCVCRHLPRLNTRHGANGVYVHPYRIHATAYPSHLLASHGHMVLQGKHSRRRRNISVKLSSSYRRRRWMRLEMRPRGSTKMMCWGRRLVRTLRSNRRLGGDMRSGIKRSSKRGSWIRRRRGGQRQCAARLQSRQLTPPLATALGACVSPRLLYSCGTL